MMKKNSIMRMTAGVLSVSMLFGIAGNLSVNAATEHWNDASYASKSWETYKSNWSTISSNYENVSLTPGTDQSKLNYAWYCKTQETPKVRISTKEDMSGAKEFTGKQQAITTIEKLAGYYSNKVTVSDLKENTTYYYQVFKNGQWQETKKYSTKSFSDYSFLYVGDPQIGACKGQTSSEAEEMKETDDQLAARNDSYNWDKTLKNALANHPDVSFMVSAGDQVNTADNEAEYAGYLGASALSSLPVATTIGNHDSKSVQYSLHYNNPNTFDGSQEDYTKGSTVAGSDYYYRYGETLFIVLDTNNYNCATHENVMKKAVEENKDAKWRVVTFHQDIYGSGYDHSDSDGIVLRTQLTPLMDKYDIDAVLQGHDHTYSRTYQLTGDGKEHTSYEKLPFDNKKAETEEEAKNAKTAFLAQNNCYNIKSDVKGGTVMNPEGCVYFEANSATGSKFYNLISSQQDYIAERSQTWSPSYSVVNVTDTTFSVTTYDAETGAVMPGSSTYTIVKEADKKTLKEAISNAKNKSNPEEYTKESIARVNLALEKANTVLENKNAKDSEIAEVTVDLTKAVTELKVKAEQKITVADQFDKKLNESPFSLSATANGKLTYASDNEKAAVVTDNGVVALTGEGTANITVKAAATDTEKAAVKTVRVNVSKAQETGEKTAAVQKKTVKLKKVSGIKVSAKKKGTLDVSFKKVSGAKGYQIVYASNKKLTKNANYINVGKSTTKKTIKKLSKGKTYYVGVRAYKTTDGEEVYGSVSTVKKVTVK